MSKFLYYLEKYQIKLATKFLSNIRTFCQTRWTRNVAFRKLVWKFPKRGEGVEKCQCPGGTCVCRHRGGSRRVRKKARVGTVRTRQGGRYSQCYLLSYLCVLGRPLLYGHQSAWNSSSCSCFSSLWRWNVAVSRSNRTNHLNPRYFTPSRWRTCSWNVCCLSYGIVAFVTNTLKRSPLSGPEIIFVPVECSV